MLGEDAARSVHGLREDLGIVAASDLPMKNRDGTTAVEVAMAIRRLCRVRTQAPLLRTARRSGHNVTGPAPVPETRLSPPCLFTQQRRGQPTLQQAPSVT